MRKWISSFVQRFVPSTATATQAGQPLEDLEGRRLFASSLAYGINTNAITSSNYPKIVKMLNDTGTKTVRLWLNVNSYGSRSETGIFKYIRKFSNDGFDTTVTVDPPKHSSNDDAVRNSFKWLADELGDYVDRWQVGNEVDKEFGNLKNYVNDILKPAAEGLHSKGEKVISGSVTWDPADVKELASYGMLNYVDMVGYHPYRKSVADLKEAVAEVKDIANGKPLVATEWNVRGSEGNKAEWAEEIKAFWPTIRDNFYAAYYFAAIKVNTMAGPAGVLTSGGSANGAFYSVYKGLKNDFSQGGQGGSQGGSQGGTDNTTVNNNPSSIGKPSIGGYKVIDAVTGNTIAGYENVSGTVSIKLSSLKNKQIQIRALTSSNTGSVKFTFTGRATRTENTAPFTAFGDSKNRETSWTAKKGTYTLSGTAYTADNAKGTASVKASLVLKFV